MAEEFEFLKEALLDPKTNLMDSSQHALAFAAKHKDEDTPLYHEAMRGPHREGYREAMRGKLSSWKKGKLGPLFPGLKKARLYQALGLSEQKGTPMGH